MGLCHSKRTKAENSLYRSLPAKDEAVYCFDHITREHKFERYEGWHAFYSSHGKRQFAELVIFVMSENHRYDLDDLQFDIYYIRAPDLTTVTYHAAFVAKDGKAVKHTFFARYGGSTHCAAFIQLKIAVEKRAALLLKGETPTGPNALPNTIHQAGSADGPDHPLEIIHQVKSASEGGGGREDQQPPPYAAANGTTA